jgi:hypothetical protein
MSASPENSRNCALQQSLFADYNHGLCWIGITQLSQLQETTKTRGRTNISGHRDGNLF